MERAQAGDPAMISAIGTYLPPWAGVGGARVAGPDEDTVTLAVAAGLAALEAAGDGAAASVESVVLVGRDLPLLEGGNAAVLLGGLGLPSGVDVVERVGGAPATTDAVTGASSGTLVIGADSTGPAGAAAVLVGPAGGELVKLARSHRSLPLRVRAQDGSVHEDDDPRLQRERGVRASIEAAGLPGKPSVVAGLRRKDAAPFCEGDVPELPTLGASAPIFALAALRDGGVLASIEQATLSAASWSPGSVSIGRDEPVAQPVRPHRPAPGPDIKIAFTAYERAFDAKLGWRAGQCPTCATLAFPPRYRCLGCGAENTSTLVPLPRTGTVYTTTTIHVPVPGLASPYSLAVVQLDGVDVRALVHVTDSAPGVADVDAPGRLVLRRVAIRSGVPDYGYAFSPEVKA
jgi:uncharacterized OB-fold protein